MKKIVHKFALIFRMDLTDKETSLTLDLKQWEGWIYDLALKNKLSDWGNWLSIEGRVIKPNNAVSDRPYAEKSESVIRYILIKAACFDEAVNLAKGCPILQGEGACVEIRKVEE